VSGANLPSGENLTVLTRWVAARVPGFSGLHRASASFLERVEDLADPEQDETRFEALLAEPPIVPSDAVPAELRRYLTQRADPQSVLAMPFIGSRSYFAGLPPKPEVADSTVVNLRATGRV
jgi:hypothetical protein